MKERVSAILLAALVGALASLAVLNFFDVEPRNSRGLPTPVAEHAGSEPHNEPLPAGDVTLSTPSTIVAPETNEQRAKAVWQKPVSAGPLIDELADDPYEERFTSSVESVLIGSLETPPP